MRDLDASSRSLFYVMLQKAQNIRAGLLPFARCEVINCRVKSHRAFARLLYTDRLHYYRGMGRDYGIWH